MNTKFEYMYRDASNYKSHREVVVTGHYAGVEKEVEKYLLDGLNFKAEEVGFPSAFFWEPQVGEEIYPRRSDDDHPWHEMSQVEPTNAPSTLPGVTIHDVMAKFWEGSATGWNADGEGVAPRIKKITLHLPSRTSLPKERHSSKDKNV